MASLKRTLAAPAALVSLVALAVTGLSGPASAAGPLQKIGKGEGQVDIVAWAGYIERGATDKNFDWVTEFDRRPAAARSTSRRPARPTKWWR